MPAGRSRSPERRLPPHSLVLARTKGNGSGRKQSKASEVSPDAPLVAESSKRIPSEKAGGTTVKMLMDEELTTESHIRHRSPGIIARLMGLDTLPASKGGVRRQQRSSGGHVNSIFCGNSVEKNYASDEGSCRRKSFEFLDLKDILHRRSTDELPESKDVYEVMEAAKVNTQKKSRAKNGKPNSAEWNANSKDAHRLRRNLVDASHLTSDDQFQSLKDRYDKLEVRPRGTTTKKLPKQCLDLNCSPPQVNKITILKPRKNRGLHVTIPDLEDDCRETTKQQEAGKSFMYLDSNSTGYSSCEDSDSFAPVLDLPEPVYQGLMEASAHPTKIVVLKPRLENAGNVEGAFQLTNRILFSAARRHGEYQRKDVNTRDFGNSRVQNLEAMHLRDIDREIVNGGSLAVHKSDRSSGNWKQRQEMRAPHNDLNNSEKFYASCDLHVDWTNKFSCPVNSPESPHSKHDLRQQHDKWKSTPQYEDLFPVSRAPRVSVKMQSSEMELLADVHRKRPNDAGQEIGMSSRCNRKADSRNSGTHKVSTSSSVANRSQQLSVHYDDTGELNGMDNMVATDSLRELLKRQRKKPSSYKNHQNDDCVPLEREIHVNTEEPVKSCRVPGMPTEKNTQLRVLNEFLKMERPAMHSANLQRQDLPRPTVSQVATKHEHFGECSEFAIQEEQDGSPWNVPATRSCSSCKSESTSSAVQAEQPCLDSACDSSPEDDSSYSGCFQKLSADLKELRTQLRFLKMDSADRYTEEACASELSDEVRSMQGSENVWMHEGIPYFQNEEERDFYYLLDIFICWGVRVVDRDELFAACYSLDRPISPVIFDKLEQKFGGLVLWRKSERKLLFDLANHHIADVISTWTDSYPPASSIRLQPKWDAQRFVEEFLQTAVLQPKESVYNEDVLADDLIKFCPGGSMRILCYEIADSLSDDLFEDLAADLFIMLGTTL